MAFKCAMLPNPHLQRWWLYNNLVLSLNQRPHRLDVGQIWWEAGFIIQKHWGRESRKSRLQVCVHVRVDFWVQKVRRDGEKAWKVASSLLPYLSWPLEGCPASSGVHAASRFPTQAMLALKVLLAQTKLGFQTH